MVFPLCVQRVLHLSLPLLRRAPGTLGEGLLPRASCSLINSLKTLSSNAVTLGGRLQHLDLGEKRSVADGEPRKRGRA